MAFIWSLRAEEMMMTSKPRKVISTKIKKSLQFGTPVYVFPINVMSKFTVSETSVLYYLCLNIYYELASM